MGMSLTDSLTALSLPSHLSVLDLHLPEGLLIQVDGELLAEGDDADGPVAQHGAQDGGEEAVALLALRGRLRHLLPLLLLLLLQHLPPPRHLCPQLRHQVCGQHVQLGLWTGGDRGVSIGANVQLGLWGGEDGCVCVSKKVQLSLWTRGDRGARVSVTVQMGLWRGDGCVCVNVTVQMGLWTGGA